MPRRQADPRQDDEAVSAVVGTVLVLAITIVGIAGLLLWGAPTLERVQAQNAQAVMEGEFEGLRDATQGLSVPDTSRFPSVSVPSGELLLDNGTRFLLAANHDPDYPACDLHATGWAGAAATAQVTISVSGCRSGTVEVASVSGTTVSIQATAAGGGTLTVGGADFSQGDWRFRLTDGAANPTVYAQAWLHSGDAIGWRLTTGQGTRELFLDGGAIFARQGGGTFLTKAPLISDASTGAGYYGLWLRTLDATTRGSIASQGTFQVFFALGSNDLRVDEDEVDSLRYSFAGDLAESWCNALLARNRALDGIGAAYTADPSASCAAGAADGMRSVTFAYDDGSPFQLRLLHARIHASLVV